MIFGETGNPKAVKTTEWHHVFPGKECVWIWQWKHACRRIEVYMHVYSSVAGLGLTSFTSTVMQDTLSHPTGCWTRAALRNTNNPLLCWVLPCDLLPPSGTDCWPPTSSPISTIAYNHTYFSLLLENNKKVFRVSQMCGGTSPITGRSWEPWFSHFSPVKWKTTGGACKQPWNEDN